jgi:hypothetical protein
MSSSIDNILIPIARSYNTQKAVAEATKLAKPWQTTIHLICLMRPGNPFQIARPASAFERMLNNDLDSYLKALLNLMHWKDLIEKSIPGIAVRIHLKAGFSWQSLIMRTSQKVGAGTIILAPWRVRHWFAISSTAFKRSEKARTPHDPFPKKKRGTDKRFDGFSLNTFHHSLSKN